jgi:ribonuclease Z
VLTHVSSRYSDDTSQLLEDALQEFKNVCVADELMVIEIPYRNA